MITGKRNEPENFEIQACKITPWKCQKSLVSIENYVHVEKIKKLFLSICMDRQYFIYTFWVLPIKFMIYLQWKLRPCLMLNERKMKWQKQQFSNWGRNSNSWNISTGNYKRVKRLQGARKPIAEIGPKIWYWNMHNAYINVLVRQRNRKKIRGFLAITWKWLNKDHQ